MATNGRFVVAVSRTDGTVRPFEIPTGTTVHQVLKKLYSEQEIPSVVNDVRINGNVVENVLEHVLVSGDGIFIIPAVKGGKA